MREVRLEFDQVSKRNTELEEQVEKYKTAVEAQKKYINGLTNAMELSDQAREKMKEEIKGKLFSSAMDHIVCFTLVNYTLSFSVAGSSQSTPRAANGT